MTKELIKKYADKIIEVVYYDTIPDKETVGKVIYALIDELSCQQTKALTDEIDKLKSKVSNWMDKYIEVNEENKQLQSRISELEKALENASSKIIDYSSCLTSIQDIIN